MSRSNVRKGRIPGTLVLNWQSPEAQHGKTLTRRPMTACEACRTAKVKCDAQRECGRCKARGLRCRYLTRGSAGRDGPELDTPLERNLVGPEGGSSAESQESSQMLPDLPIDLESGTLQTASDAIDWEGDGAFNRALEQFDWVFSDTNLTVRFAR